MSKVCIHMLQDHMVSGLRLCWIKPSVLLIMAKRGEKGVGKETTQWSYAQAKAQIAGSSQGKKTVWYFPYLTLVCFTKRGSNCAVLLPWCYIWEKKFSCLRITKRRSREIKADPHYTGSTSECSFNKFQFKTGKQAKQTNKQKKGAKIEKFSQGSHLSEN